MLLFKDYSTGKKSLTITGVILTFAALFADLILSLLGYIPPNSIGWFTIPFSIFAALYWNKRIRANSSGVEIDDNSVPPNT